MRADKHSKISFSVSIPIFISMFIFGKPKLLLFREIGEAVTPLRSVVLNRCKNDLSLCI